MQRSSCGILIRWFVRDKYFCHFHRKFGTSSAFQYASLTKPQGKDTENFIITEDTLTVGWGFSVINMPGHHLQIMADFSKEKKKSL